MKNNTLKEAVMKDPLTGLMNRRYMFEVEERKIRRFIESRERKIHLIDNRNLLEIEKNNDSVYGVIMMDIDHFKRVNDLYGHDAGDVVLKGIAEIMQDSVRADDILIRWGGEEFLIVLKNIPMRKLFEVAKKIRKAIEMHPFDTQNGSTVWVTASMGVVFLPFFSLEPKLLTFENVITIADMALYYSKENGRDMATFVAPGKNIPETADDINGMLGSSEFAEVNGFYTFEKIEPDNFSEFEI
jgi:diguanylate cyclase (GGDEF)-like protein